ncbi:MAG: DUF5615 family PIN-like protein [Prosthecobacter sp.]|uniref:DUF5615 family PIN-like protein n=1 Tax=Prosthecobacter sp. TaxID=1965333 RepID=UPI0038FE9562
MRVLIDECLPRPLKSRLTGHDYRTVQEMGWDGVKNGQLLLLAEQDFEVFLTGDKNLRYQQNLATRQIAIVLLPTTHWPTLQQQISLVQTAMAGVQLGEFVEVAFG